MLSEKLMLRTAKKIGFAIFTILFASFRTELKVMDLPKYCLYSV